MSLLDIVRSSDGRVYARLDVTRAIVLPPKEDANGTANGKPAIAATSDVSPDLAEIIFEQIAQAVPPGILAQPASFLDPKCPKEEIGPRCAAIKSATDALRAAGRIEKRERGGRAYWIVAGAGGANGAAKKPTDPALAEVWGAVEKLVPLGPIEQAAGIADLTQKAKAFGITPSVLRAQLKVFIKTAKAAPSPAEYFVHEGAHCMKTPSGDVRRLTDNFEARIVEEVEVDDDLDTNTTFHLVGSIRDGRALPPIDVRSTEWLDPQWLPAKWGSTPRISPGSWSLVLLAIQAVSKPKYRVHYTHTGWREVAGKEVFLWPGGAIGAVNIDVAKIEAPYVMCPVSPTKAELKKALQASLKFLDGKIAPDEIAIPVYASVWLAPLSSALGVNFAIWLVGPTGVGKSGMNAAAVQHYGPFAFDKLPAGWHSTANNLEAVLFQLKDMLVVIDNYIPGLSKLDVANRILQQIGDRAARGRQGRNNEQLPAHPPRGLCLSSGEDVPRAPTGSTLGRVVVVPAAALDKVTSANRVKALMAYEQNGALLRVALRGYIEWLLGKGPKYRKQLSEERDVLAAEIQRAELGSEMHPRAPRNVATMLIAFRAFEAYCHDSDVRIDGLEKRARAALLVVARAQGQDQRAESPAEKYVDALRAILAQGRAHLVEGTRSDLNGDDGHTRAIGWRDTKYVYLDSTLAWDEVVRFYGGLGEWPHTKHAVYRDLADAGYLERDAEQVARVKRLGSPGPNQLKRVLWMSREKAGL